MGPEETIYSKRQGLILGFHGTDECIVRDIVIRAKELAPSHNPWDWIGHGIYFWEHSPARALEYAQTASLRKGSLIKSPAVLGAVLDLGYCLDLLDYEYSPLLKHAYEFTQERIQNGANETLQNKSIPTSHDDLVLRFLDCAVIEAVHDLNKLHQQPPFDSVRSVFWEGPPLYPTAGFREKNHIQICVRNPNCIKGFFLPRKYYSKP